MLLVAPCYRNPAHGPTPGAVFTSTMISEATIDRIVELLKLTNSGAVEFTSTPCAVFTSTMVCEVTIDRIAAFYLNAWLPNGSVKHICDATYS